MAENKTKFTNASVEGYLASKADEQQRADCKELMALFKKITGGRPRMWGPTIVGYGSYDYVYETGNKGSICVVGFSPRGANLVIYSGLMAGDEANAPLLSKLGKYKTGKGCLYINKLADVDEAVLRRLIERSWKHTAQKYPQ